MDRLRNSRRIASLSAERRFQLLVDGLTDCAVYMLDSDGSVASWNSGAERITGYGAGEIVGRRHEVFFSTEDQERGLPQKLLERARADSRHEIEGWRVRKDRSRFWALGALEAIRDENGQFVGFAVVIRDMTEREATRRALADSEKQLRLLVRGVTDYALYMLDPNGIITSWNSGAERIKGYRSDEILGLHFSCFYTAPDRLAGVPRRALETAAAAGRYEAEALRVRKDGSQFWANVVIDAIRDECGTLVGFAKITRDITEKREAQEVLKQAEAQLAQRQKMEALSQLTGGIAHDFNNLLMIVGGQTELLKRRAASEKDVRALDAIEHAVKQGSRLTRQMLAFARANPHTRALVNLRDRVNAYRDLLASAVRGDISLVVDVDPDVWPVHIDAGEFDLALINLAVNARDAMLSGGSMSLKMENRVFTDKSEIGEVGEFVAVSVSDSGTGIPSEHLSRVFEPFFSTKAPGKGTGLGLSQVYGFAQHSGGSAQLRSELGQGTTVTIFLPRANGDLAAEPPERDSGEAFPAVSGAVLVVEDNARVGEVSAALVEQLGYRAIMASDARDALEILQRERDIVLVFSDIVMPGEMDGIALARAVRARHPDIPILLTSGYSKLAETAEKDFPILRKPYEISALARSVVQTIRARAPSQ